MHKPILDNSKFACACLDMNISAIASKTLRLIQKYHELCIGLTSDPTVVTHEIQGILLATLYHQAAYSVFFFLNFARGSLDLH
jgi:hypothetical protein